MRITLYLMLLVLSTGWIIFAGCEENNDTEKEKIVLNDTTEIRYEQCLKYPGDEYTVCFDTVVTDSRCPIGVYCFWGGTAAVRFGFTDPGSKTDSVDLYLGTIDSLIHGYKFSFIELMPYPDIHNPHTIDDYIAKIIVRP